MPQLSSTGVMKDTGVAQESGAHRINESPAHQRSAIPPMPAPPEIACKIGWKSLWASSWQCQANTATSPNAGDTTITIGYFFPPVPGSHGETQAVGIGVGMSVDDGRGTYAPGTTVTSVSGLVVGLSHPVALSGAGVGGPQFNFSGLFNQMYPSSWDAFIYMPVSPFTNFDNNTNLTFFGIDLPGGTDAGVLDGDGYELYNAPGSWFTVDFTGGTSNGWSHDSTPSLYSRIYPATTDGGTGLDFPDPGPVNSYLFQFGASVDITSTQTFPPANYSGGISITGTTTPGGDGIAGTNSDFSGSLFVSGIEIDFNLTSGFSCSTAGVITSNTGSSSAGWSCNFAWNFLYPWNILIRFNNMSYDATFGKPNAGGVLYFDWIPA